jgi:hypothetical protein
MEQVKINGKNIPLDFDGKLEVHLSPSSYGVFDVIGKAPGDSESKTLFKNAAVSFINPVGSDQNGISGFVTIEGDKPYVVDCATYKKICLLEDLEELKQEFS